MCQPKRETCRWMRQFIFCIPLLLAACGSLPTINPDMALHNPKSIQMEGARGPLSNKQIKAVLAKLQKGADDTNIFDRHLAIEQEVGDSPLMVGNQVDLLVDGPATYESMFAAIDQAQSTIDMETFILEPDEIGQRFVDALLKKQQQGVQVNLIYDSAGSLYTPATFFQSLRDAGAHVVEYNPLNPLNAKKSWNLNERDHRKLLVIDGKIAYVGGINISSVYSSGSFGGAFASSGGTNKRYKEQAESDKKHSKSDGLAWRDTHVRMEGPVVAEFQKLFIATWENQKGEPLNTPDYFPQPITVGQEVVRAIGSTPSDPFSVIYVTFISAINSAESQIYITNAYFIPDRQMMEALEEAAERGVDVRLLLPSKTDSSLVSYASRSYYDELLEAGVKIYERQDALLHAKTAMIDGVWSTVGSTNMDWRSFLNNQEINAVILGPNFANRLQALYEKDLQDSKEITLYDWKHRSILMRLKETGARFWARFL